MAHDTHNLHYVWLMVFINITGESNYVRLVLIHFNNLFYFTDYRFASGSGRICVYKSGQIPI